MRKRLRKKKHLGEFAEIGREIGIVLKNPADFNHFFYQIIEAAECLGLTLGGGGGPENIGFMIELGYRDECDGNWEKIKNWLDTCPSILSYDFSEPMDLWR